MHDFLKSPFFFAVIKFIFKAYDVWMILEEE